MVTLRQWPYCPNKNVLSERLNCPYDSSGCRNTGGKLFHSRDAAAANYFQIAGELHAGIVLTQPDLSDDLDLDL